MLSIFGSSSPFDSDVEKATSENNTTEQWDLILDICDKVGSSSKNAKDCIRSIMRRMGHTDPHVAIQAITLLDAGIKNCGIKFHLEIASRDFEQEFQRLMSKAPSAVAQKMRVSLKKWAENEFKSDSQLNLIPTLYQKLKSEGYDFSDTSSTPKAQPVLSKDPNVVSSQQEEDDIAKAIELSLKDKGDGAKAPASASSYPSLYPSMNSNSSQSKSSSSFSKKEARKVRALYDFEAAEDNELTFYSGEIIHVTDDSDPNWWTGYNDRGDGLFPSNFVTADLNAEIESDRYESKAKKSVQFCDELKEEPRQEKVEIDEAKIDRLLYLLHEANPEDPSQDPEEMYILEAQVNQMLPLIDCELERVDRHHAKLTQLSSNLVDAINMYHTLMRESDLQMTGYQMNQMPPHMYRQPGQPMPNGMYSNPNMYAVPTSYGMQMHNQYSNQMGPTSLPHMAPSQYQPNQPASLDPTKFIPNGMYNPQQQQQAGPQQQQPMQMHPQMPGQYQFGAPNEQQQQHQIQQQMPSTASNAIPNSLPGMHPQQNDQVNATPLPHQHQQLHGQPAMPHMNSVPPQANQFVPIAGPVPSNFVSAPHSMPPQSITSQQSVAPQSIPPQPMLNNQQQMPNMGGNGGGYLPNTVMSSQVQHVPMQHAPLPHMQHASPNHQMMPNLAAINQPVTSTILPQPDSRANIPIYQQQR